MKKFIVWCFILLEYTSLLGQIKILGSKDPNKRSSSQPALPYGPKKRESWYTPRIFKETDFPAPSEFESRRQETENLRQQVVKQSEDLSLNV